MFDVYADFTTKVLNWGRGCAYVAFLILQKIADKCGWCGCNCRRDSVHYVAAAIAGPDLYFIFMFFLDGLSFVKFHVLSYVFVKKSFFLLLYGASAVQWVCELHSV